MEINDDLMAALQREGEGIRSETLKAQSEQRKLNENREFWTLRAFKEAEQEKISEIYKATPEVASATVLLKKAQEALREAKATHATEAYTAEVQLRELVKALKAFILTGKAVEMNGKQITSARDALVIYTGIRMVMKVKAKQ